LADTSTTITQMGNNSSNRLLGPKVNNQNL
jgi:hypothetical protein